MSFETYQGGTARSVGVEASRADARTETVSYAWRGEARLVVEAELSPV
jgi:hypothetical protein